MIEVGFKQQVGDNWLLVTSVDYQTNIGTFVFFSTFGEMEEWEKRQHEKAVGTPVPGIVLVIAGSAKHFRREMEDRFPGAKVRLSNHSFIHNGKDYRYVSDPIRMRGFSDVDVQFWGSSHLLKNLAEFQELANIIQWRKTPGYTRVPQSVP